MKARPDDRASDPPGVESAQANERVTKVEAMFSALAKGYQSVTQATNSQPQSAESTIDKLVDRLLNGQQLEDRRAALLGLKGLSRDWKQEVGSRALPVLLGVLEEDASQDTEIAKAVVETLSVLCEIEQVDGRPVRDDSGLRNTDAFLSTASPLHTLLQLLTSPHFYLRYFALQLIGILLNNRPQQVQQHVLTAPGGVGRLVETLHDSREIIRNEALLLIIGLTTSNADIQKLLAFEGSFDKLFAIIKSEGGIGAGGIVVQDCLAAIGGLLRWNVSNQNYFRETSCIPLLAPLLHFPQANAITPASLNAFAFQSWSEQKVINAGLVISLIRMLVGGAGSGRAGNQKALLATGVTRCLSELALASNAPAVLKAQALNALADILRGSEPNQTFFTSLVLTPLIPPSAPSHESTYAVDNDAQPEEHRWTKGSPILALTALTSLAVYGDGTPGRDGLCVRAGACAAFESHVGGSRSAQMAILRSMVEPSSASSDLHNSQTLSASQHASSSTAPLGNGHARSEEATETSGTILLDALRTFPAVQSGRSFDSYETFFASLMFAHLVQHNDEAKAFARGVLAPPNRSPDQSLDEDEPTLVNILVGNLMMAQREQAQSANAGASAKTVLGWTRVMCGYLIVLSVWLWESPQTVKDFLSEGSNIQVLIQPITQSSGVDSLVQGLCAFLLGIVYEYNREPGDITRETLHPILQSRVGPDQFVSRILRLREDPRFRTVGPNVFEMNDEEEILDDIGDDGLGLWFDYSFVEFLKTNYIAVQRAILLDPNAAEAGRKSMEGADGELLNSLRTTIAMQAAELDRLKQEVANIERERREEREAYRAESASLTEQLVAVRSELAEAQNARTDGDREQEDLLVLLEEMSLKRKADKSKLRQAGYDVSEDEEEEENDADERPDHEDEVGNGYQNDYHSERYDERPEGHSDEQHDHQHDQRQDDHPADEQQYAYRHHDTQHSDVPASTASALFDNLQAQQSDSGGTPFDAFDYAATAHEPYKAPAPESQSAAESRRSMSSVRQSHDDNDDVRQQYFSSGPSFPQQSQQQYHPFYQSAPNSRSSLDRASGTRFV